MTNYKEEIEKIKESLENVIKTLQEELERLNSSELNDDKLQVFNGLMWSESIGEDLTFDQAQEFAKNCRDGGFRDWRVPTAKEWLDTIGWEDGINRVNAVGYYWSSTQSSATVGCSLYFYSGYSYLNYYSKTSCFPVRCVRDIKENK